MGQGTNTTRKRWRRLMEAWSLNSNEDTFQALVDAYSEPGRHYHTLAHVDACLHHLDRCSPDVERPCELELALWFHDAVYQPLSGDNEKRSADWASSFLLENGASPEAAARVHRLIMVTEHNVPTVTRDESFLVDIDLTILGSDANTYEVFERGVRQEYQEVPETIFRKRRAEVLKGFLERGAIYQNEPFTTERETQARLNLATALTRLES